ncbi:PspC domain-containing protein [Priestia flexa]|uniref:PspC domain-containing protein n=1 Tax=Priestia flexa TaxID=86664 RepID=UPI001B3266F8|nr:PspC domain-containing protein [Priestia flexa]
MKKLYRSRKNRKLAGIIGGISEYTGVSATILRLIFALSVLFVVGTPLVVIYIILIFVLPNEEGAY